MRETNSSDSPELDLALLESTAAALGLRIATKCKTCGHWLTSPRSRADHQGPRCRVRSQRGIA